MTMTRRQARRFHRGQMAWASCPPARGRVGLPAEDIKAICNFPPGTRADVFVRFFAERCRRHHRQERAGRQPWRRVRQRRHRGGRQGKADGYTPPDHAGELDHGVGGPHFQEARLRSAQGLHAGHDAVEAELHRPGRPEVTRKTVADLTAALKAKRGKATYGVNSNTGLITAELYNKLSGAGATKIPLQRQSVDHQRPVRRTGRLHRQGRSVGDRAGEVRQAARAGGDGQRPRRFAAARADHGASGHQGLRQRRTVVGRVRARRHAAAGRRPTGGRCLIA